MLHDHIELYNIINKQIPITYSRKKKKSLNTITQTIFIKYKHQINNKPATNIKFKFK